MHQIDKEKVMNYLHPTTQDSLLDALGAMTPNSYCIAGCTDFLLQYTNTFREADVLVDLTGCEAMKQIQFVDEKLRIGAICTHAQIASNQEVRTYYPALATACASIGSAQIRNRGTIGGSIANAAPSADVYPCLLIYEAQIEVLSANGQISLIPADDFISADGIPRLPTGEIITAVHLPMPAANTKASFAKLGEREQVSIAKINMAGLLHHQDGTPQSLRLAIGAIGPRARLYQVPADQLATPEVFADYCSLLVQEAIKERASVAYKSIAVKALATKIL